MGGMLGRRNGSRTPAAAVLAHAWPVIRFDFHTVLNLKQFRPISWVLQAPLKGLLLIGNSATRMGDGYWKMRAFKKKITDKKALQELVPLNALSDKRFTEVMDKIVVDEIRSGGYLFRKGDRDNQSIYLLNGKVNLIDGRRKVTSEIEAGTDYSLYPIANQQPRTLSARAATKVVIARIDSGLLDAFLTWDHSPGAEVTEINSDNNEDWMTRMLQSEAFERIPPAGIQRLLMKMKSLPVQGGEVIVREGEEGDFFYTIHNGRCIITRKTSPDSDDEVLAELSSGDCFGEEALVSDKRRNATVTMLTDGMLMRLAKKDFIELLQKPLVRYVSYEVASAMVDDGAVWVDVRSEGEFEEGAIEESVNIPLSTLRSEMSELVFNSQYIVCCDTGSRSVSAAFILSHKGFEVYVLESGLNGMSPDELAQAGLPAQGIDLALATKPAMDQQHSEAISFPQGRKTAADGGQLPEIESLQRENEALRRQVRAHQQEDENSFKRQLQLQSSEEENQLLREQNAALQKDSNIHINRLQLELKDARDRIQALQTETGNSVRNELRQQEQAESEQQSLKLQVEQLEGKSMQYAEHMDALQVELQAANEQVRQLQAESALQHDEEQQLVETLRTELAQSRRHSEELQARITAEQQEKQAAEVGANTELSAQRGELQALREQSAQAARQVEALQVDLQAAQEQINQSRIESETQLQEQQQLVETQRTELTRSEQRAQALQQEIEALQSEKQAIEEISDSTLRERSAELEQLNHQLTQALTEKGGLGERLAGAQDKADELQQQLEKLDRRNNAGLEELQEHNSQLTEELDRTHVARQDLENQVDVLQSQRLEVQQELEASRSENSSGLARVQQLQQEIESLQGENQRLRVEHHEVAEGSKGLESEKQAMFDRLQELQQELESQSNTFTDQVAAYEQQLANLGGQLEQARETASKEQQRLETVLQQYKDESEARLEQQQHHQDEIEQEQDSLATELEGVIAERDELGQRLSTSEHDIHARQQEIDRLNDTIATLTNTADQEVQVLNERLAAEQAHVSRAEESAEEQRVRTEALQAELDHKEQSINELLEQVQAAKQQSEEGWQAQQQHEAQAQVLEQERQAALQAVQTELDNKNDLEREMRGQIERLGKKLEQSPEDLQRIRDEAHENEERLRNELAEERSARTEERAEMAARQKELKQQLAEVAGKHEGVLASQTDIVEQAREEARREERERLQHELEPQGQSNDQAVALPAELEKLREEAAAALEQERKRSESDLAVARDQRAQMKAEHVGLTNQLKQLTQERDEALNGRKLLEKQLNALNKNPSELAESAGTGGTHEDKDMAQLQEELEDARMNIEIAVRLRTESEAELEQMTGHRDQLLSQLEELNSAEGNIPAPVQDNNGNKIAARQRASIGSGGKAEFKYVVDDDDGGKRRWLGAVVGLGVAGIAGLVFWLMLSFEDPMAKFLDLVNMDKARSAWSEFRLPQWLDSAAKPEDEAATQELKATQTSTDGAQPVAKTPPKTAVKAAQTPAVELPRARRSFRDALSGGGRGPLMLELPAGSFLMGAEGNSLSFEERPQHPVGLASFSISKYEVSFAEYGRFARATGRRLPHDEKWGRGDRPVINVTWKDARAYAGWLSKQTGQRYRLPTEAEWEYAARAGTTTDYWWDIAARATMANCFNCGSEWDGNSSAPVGSFPANSLGLHDTAGNVQEWTEDCYYPSYQGAPADGSARTRAGCTQYVARGGSYTSPIESLRSNKRAHYVQDTRIDNLGFRMVRVQ